LIFIAGTDASGLRYKGKEMALFISKERKW